MAYIRFFRKIRLSQKFTINISKKGLSVTFNGKVLRITIGKNGIRLTSGLRGTGISISEYIKHKNK